MRSINSDSDNIVGYRFHPTDKELVDHYLCNKILGRDSLVQAITEVNNLFNKDPWELPRYSKIKSADQVWYFFSRREDNKMIKRTTDKGFWKVTGKARNVKGKNGGAMKRSLVFYEGRSPNAKWTPWVIHEYTFTSTDLENKEGIFLCKLKNKDENVDALSSESCQPSQVADDEILENSAMFNPDEMLATLEEPDGRNEAENNFSHAKQLVMCEDQVPYSEGFTYPYDFSGASDAIQDLSNFDEQNDESWTTYLVDDKEYYVGERMNEQDEYEGCNLLPLVDLDTSMIFPGESSRKRSRFEDGVLCEAIENQECQATYEQAESASSLLDEHTGSEKFQAMAMVNAPNVTLTTDHDSHGREKMLSVHNEPRKSDTPSIDSASALHCIYSVALASINPHYQKERSQNLIEQEDDPKGTTNDKAIDIQQHAGAVNLPQKENAVLISNRKRKTSGKNNGNASLLMHFNEAANSDKKRFLYMPR